MPSALEILLAPKTCPASKRPRTKPKPGHRSLEVLLDCSMVAGELVVYVRQSIEQIENYSTGLRWQLPGERPRMLIRVNGSSHEHGNPDRRVFTCVPHVHVDLDDLDLDPRPGADPRWAFELDSPYTSLTEAFRLLCEVARIDPSAQVLAAVRRCAGSAQLALSLDHDDDTDDGDD